VGEARVCRDEVSESDPVPRVRRRSVRLWQPADVRSYGGREDQRGDADDAAGDRATPAEGEGEQRRQRRRVETFLFRFCCRRRHLGLQDRLRRPNEGAGLGAGGQLLQEAGALRHLGPGADGERGVFLGVFVFFFRERERERARAGKNEKANSSSFISPTLLPTPKPTTTELTLRETPTSPLRSSPSRRSSSPRPKSGTSSRARPATRGL
jgi:hypothetical protein